MSKDPFYMAPENQHQRFADYSHVYANRAKSYEFQQKLLKDYGFHLKLSQPERWQKAKELADLAFGRL